ncbi:chorismate mutase [uncultured Methanoregula sp.]|uniref:chorismate mutase n=1 Tax=uncultured Methanoregula sp. TaxID=1005933 RepID=UPI002AABD9EC|nr:chorismate mutase [uncultured Methanoregula sp.]
MTLEQARADISRIDTEIIRLIAVRQELAGQVAAIKAAEGLPTHDAGRSAEVLRSVSAQAEGFQMDPAPVRKIFETLIAMSEDRQRELRDKGKSR